MSQPTTVLDQDRPADEFDLDIEFIEAGDTVERIIQMTEDGCGSTCASACTSC
ncbi:FxLD family lantipeptide [Catenuloplanes nepalensis]|uniref:FxLD family lantipeptide n=1 Tax=Catenuloplanes nepalensis TaxID=587533 RepID=A0ABT9MM97_9ACTN|nr:FxLD family lanthipeptide [Catenuloplanes nepalensis]MDP9792523.1 FxLD family lantipeptide [Catenuloplanes nepalensis]